MYLNIAWLKEMMKQGASVADRKKALKAWQIKWHPDKNPDQLEVAGLRVLLERSQAP